MGGKAMTGKDSDKIYNVLFLCTGNSARSIMAEAVMNRLGQGRFKGYSAGSHPAGQVHPYALDLLQRLNHPTAGLRSKAWDEFAAPGAPQMDFVFTVCDNAAGEVCPIWPGQPMTAHWPFQDPAAFEGTEAEKRQLFADVYGQIHTRVAIFANLPIPGLDKLALQKRLSEMGSRLSESA
jgi:protein-tyrosine-phosphatase